MSGDTGSGSQTPPAEPCPICRKPAQDAFTPFCSRRCADVDLGRWLGERYAIPGPEDEPRAGTGEDEAD